MSPLVLVALIIIGLLVLLVPRQRVLSVLMLGVVLLPPGDNLYVGGSHLFLFRILILIGWMRVVLTSRSSDEPFLAGGFDTIDKVFLIWAIYHALSGVLMFMQAGAIPGQIGFLWDSLGGYFLLRHLLRDEEDVSRLLKAFAAAACIFAVCMMYEHFGGGNIFARIDGVPFSPQLRGAQVRAQANFFHPLLAGSFGATLFALFIWLWKKGKAPLFGILGAVSAATMAFLAVESTCILTLVGAIGAICLWPIRKRMRFVRWSLVGGVILLALVMKAPVWFALGHLDVTGGSSGWERAELIDQFLRHFNQWYLIGTHDNVNWGWDMWDACNQFVAEGIAGGLVCLTCLIVMLSICFKRIGDARKAIAGNREKEWGLWLLGSAMFAQTLAYVGVDYFDQTRFVWFAIVAIVLAIAPRATVVVPEPEPVYWQRPAAKAPAPALGAQHSSLRLR